MNRTLFLRLDEGQVIARCLKENVQVSAIERLVSGGVRLVCMSSQGAEQMRKALKGKLLDEDSVHRERHRPVRPLW